MTFIDWDDVCKQCKKERNIISCDLTPRFCSVGKEVIKEIYHD